MDILDTFALLFEADEQPVSIETDVEIDKKLKDLRNRRKNGTISNDDYVKEKQELEAKKISSVSSAENTVEAQRTKFANALAQEIMSGGAYTEQQVFNAVLKYREHIGAQSINLDKLREELSLSLRRLQIGGHIVMGIYYDIFNTISSTKQGYVSPDKLKKYIYSALQPSVHMDNSIKYYINSVVNTLPKNEQDLISSVQREDNLKYLVASAADLTEAYSGVSGDLENEILNDLPLTMLAGLIKNYGVATDDTDFSTIDQNIFNYFSNPYVRIDSAIKALKSRKSEGQTSINAPVGSSDEGSVEEFGTKIASEDEASNTLDIVSKSELSSEVESSFNSSFIHLFNNKNFATLIAAQLLKWNEDKKFIVPTLDELYVVNELPLFDWTLNIESSKLDLPLPLNKATVDFLVSIVLTVTNDFDEVKEVSYEEMEKAIERFAGRYGDFFSLDKASNEAKEYLRKYLQLDIPEFTKQQAYLSKGTFQERVLERLSSQGMQDLVASNTDKISAFKTETNPGAKLALASSILGNKLAMEILKTSSDKEAYAQTDATNLYKDLTVKLVGSLGGYSPSSPAKIINIGTKEYTDKELLADLLSNKLDLAQLISDIENDAIGFKQNRYSTIKPNVRKALDSAISKIKASGLTEAIDKQTTILEKAYKHRFVSLVAQYAQEFCPVIKQLGRFMVHFASSRASKSAQSKLINTLLPVGTIQSLLQKFQESDPSSYTVFMEPGFLASFDSIIDTVKENRLKLSTSDQEELLRALQLAKKTENIKVARAALQKHKGAFAEIFKNSRIGRAVQGILSGKHSSLSEKDLKTFQAADEAEKKAEKQEALADLEWDRLNPASEDDEI